MKWIYKKEVNRMGEVTQTLTNESIDMPVLDEYQTPTLIIKKDRFGFGIKFCLGGLDLKGGYKIEKYYTRGCYNTYIEHQRLISNGIKKYRFRFDEDKVEENNIDYFCKDESEFKIVSDFMFSLKESKKFIVELDTLAHGIQYYEFDLEGLTELCDEHKIFQYKKPTPFEPYIPTPVKNNNFFGWLIIGILFFISIILIVYVNNREDTSTSQVLPSSDYYVDTCNTYVSSTDYKNQELKNIEKKEPIKKERKKIVKEENEDNEEYVYPSYSNTAEVKNTITSNSNDIDIEKYPLDKMIKYLKEKFPNAPEDQIIRMVKKSNVQYAVYKEEDKTEDIPTYTASLYKKSEGYYNYKEKQNEEQPKKKGLLKRLFPGRKNWNSSFYEKK